MNRTTLNLMRIVFAAGLLALAPIASAANEVLGELLLRPATAAEKRAGVWIDGQYLGYLKELKGKRKVLLLPGEHTLELTLAGYEKVQTSVLVEPGEKKTYKVKMVPDPNAVYAHKSETGQVQISIKPDRAAVFVNGHYAGHVDAYNGRSGLRVTAGKHKFKIALPGYQPFETELSVRAGQHYRIETDLVRDGQELVWTGQDGGDEEEEAE